MDPQAEALRRYGLGLAMRVAQGQPLDPEEQQIYDEMIKRGLIPNPAGVDPTRGQVATALRKPAMTSGFQRDPNVPAAQYLSSHEYGGTVDMGQGLGGFPVSPETMAQNNMEQYLQQQMGDRSWKQTPTATELAPGNPDATITDYADTEVRPWAQRTPSAYKQRGINPATAPTFAGGAPRGITEQELEEMLMMLKQKAMPAAPY